MSCCLNRVEYESNLSLIRNPFLQSQETQQGQRSSRPGSRKTLVMSIEQVVGQTPVFLNFVFFFEYCRPFDIKDGDCDGRRSFAIRERTLVA
jgi:hypothetical protein